MMGARELTLVLMTLFNGRLSDRRMRLMGEEMMDVLEDSLQDANDGEISISTVIKLVGRHDLDTRLTAYF